MSGAPTPEELAGYDAFLFDIDGTLWLDGDPLPGAVEVVRAARQRGATIRFVTNLTWHPSEEWRARLAELGFEAAPGELVAATDGVVRAATEAGIRQAAVAGGPGVTGALRHAGVETFGVSELGERAWTTAPAQRAVVLAMAPALTRAELDAVAQALRDGARLLASSVHGAMPTKTGQVAGAEALLRELRTRIAVDPVVCGKPSGPMAACVRESLGGCVRPLMVGDDAGADVALAERLGIDSLLVLTGMSGRQRSAGWKPAPTFVVPGLDALLQEAVG